MPTPNTIKEIARLAHKNNVRIIGPLGAFEVNAEGIERPIKSDEQLQQMRQEIDERFAAMTATITNVLAASSHMMAVVNSLDSHFKLAVEMHESAALMFEELEKQIANVTAVMQRPVVPVYDASGKLIGAKRVLKI